MALGKTTDKVMVATYLLRSQQDQLKAISAATDVPVSALMRRAVRDFLANYPAPSPGPRRGGHGRGAR